MTRNEIAKRWALSVILILMLGFSLFYLFKLGVDYFRTIQEINNMPERSPEPINLPPVNPVGPQVN